VNFHSDGEVRNCKLHILSEVNVQDRRRNVMA
jgi:hypothetical protein